MSRVARIPVFGFPTRSDTNRAVQSQKISESLKFRIKEVEEMYCLCSENKGADQLRSYCAADLRHCFRICQKSRVSYDAGQIFTFFKQIVQQKQTIIGIKFAT